MRPTSSARSVVVRPRTILLAAAVAALAGCTASGLSPREVRGRDYATYAYSMYDPSQFAEITEPDAPRKRVAAPARIAVAQVGEVSPPDVVIQTLRQHKQTFASVQPIPAVVDTGLASSGVTYEHSNYGGHERPDAARQQSALSAREHAQRMRRYAGDIGAEYLFLYGGTLDRATTGTGARLADVTIVGAFVVPSQKLQATATASGTLIDVQTGRAVLAVSAQAKQQRMAASAEIEKKEIELLESLRDQIARELALQLVDQVKSQSTDASARVE